MREINGGKQMKTVWTFTAPGREEKTFGKHPTQKPLALVERCLLAATPENALVLDPFLGSGTTAIACLRQRRQCVGIELDPAFTQLAIERIQAEPCAFSSAVSAAACIEPGQPVGALHA